MATNRSLIYGGYHMGTSGEAVYNNAPIVAGCNIKANFYGGFISTGGGEASRTALPSTAVNL